MKQDLTSVETHFSFGKNWASYAENISDKHIIEAESGLKQLLSGIPLRGKRFLDIGCGSGIHGLAALRLGVAELVALDLDPDSVATATELLNKSGNDNYSVMNGSVFELVPDSPGYDVVYSWGVLHHTGDLHRAIRCAASVVNPDGVLIVALYQKTWLCEIWKVIKRWYAHTSMEKQKLARSIYIFLFRLGLFFSGRRFKDYVKNYPSNRGMDFFHDVHDWLGGYPYQSISKTEMKEIMSQLGFTLKNYSGKRPHIFGRRIGFYGTGCDEYTFIKK